MELGDLSAHYESNGDPGCISRDPNDAGGASYGAYQFANAYDIPAEFARWAQRQGYQYADELANALPAATDMFDAAWKDVAAKDCDGFLLMQHNYTKMVYYDHACELLQEKLGFDMSGRSEALQQVLWSRAVQYSAYNMPDLFQEAANSASQDLNSMSDHDLIYWIYQVEEDDKEWTSGSPADRPGLFARFDSERDQAEAML